MVQNPRELITEELLGAELLASRELAESAGSLWSALERGSVIQQQQLSLLCADYATYVNDLSKADSFTLPRATAQLIERRLTHVSEGWRQFAGLLQTELAPISRAWESFFTVVSKDWRR